MIRIAFTGNCQAQVVALSARLIGVDVDADYINHRALVDTPEETTERLRSADLIISGDGGTLARVQAMVGPDEAGKISAIPSLFFTGFHPDAVFWSARETRPEHIADGCHSAIVCQAWLSGLTASQTRRLFQRETYEFLGYTDHMDVSRRYLSAQASRCGIGNALDAEYESWLSVGAFMHNPLHPRMKVLGSLARVALERAGVNVRLDNPDALAPDPLQRHLIWPVYPDLLADTSIPTSFSFKLHPSKNRPGEAFRVIDLDEFIESSFDTYARCDRADIALDRLADPRYEALVGGRRTSTSVSIAASAKAHPYQGLPSTSFWRKSVAHVDILEVDPVVRPRYTIQKSSKIATAGSCFAQHIAKRLDKSGYNYYIAEPKPPEMDPEEAADANYGVYSARYGNLYTARQLRQLFERAHHDFQPVAETWEIASDRFIDPFRPEIKKGGAASAAIVLKDRDHHLELVRQMFASLDVFVFTLGLTEAWRDVRDGAVVPIPPGVVGAHAEAANYEFVNFTAREVETDLCVFIDALAHVNPQAKILLTVSPVPLVATYEARHVLTSTVYSKSALRVAAEGASRRYGHVEYFPSYEIITGSFNRGAYFEDDLRSVRPAGVDHVMRTFFRHYTTGHAGGNSLPLPAGAVDASERHPPAVDPSATERELMAGHEIVCEEELLDI